MPGNSGDVWVCKSCYFAHHYGATAVDREATDDEAHDWHAGYLRTGHSLPNVIEETAEGLQIREWFAGDSDAPCDREPLNLIGDEFDVADNTCSNHYYEQDIDDGDMVDDGVPCDQCGQSGWEDGIEEFSWRACQGCGSTLGGSRYRLALFAREEVTK